MNKKINEVEQAAEIIFAAKEGLLESFRYGTDKFFEIINLAREYQDQIVFLQEDKDLLKTDIGTFAEFEGEQVPLDFPIVEAEKKDPPLNKPKAGGPKKFHVFVRDPKTGNIKKINFGASVTKEAITDPDRRASFVARHKCERFSKMGPEKRLQAQFWACSIPRYAKALGLSDRNYSYWW